MPRDAALHKMRDAAILDFVREYINGHGPGPTVTLILNDARERATRQAEATVERLRAAGHIVGRFHEGLGYRLEPPGLAVRPAPERAPVRPRRSTPRSLKPGTTARRYEAKPCARCRLTFMPTGPRSLYCERATCR